MEKLPDTNPYKQELIALLHAVDDQIGMETPDIVLMLMILNTEEKIVRFAEWIQTKLDGETLTATAPEIVGAASWIADGRTDLP